MSAPSQAGNGQGGGAQGSREHVESGLAVLGLSAGQDEIAVIQAVHAIYGPALDALMAEGFDGITHEPGADMSKPPRPDSER